MRQVIPLHQPDAMLARRRALHFNRALHHAVNQRVHHVVLFVIVQNDRMEIAITHVLLIETRSSVLQLDIRRKKPLLHKVREDER